MRDFVQRENVKHFERLVAEATDDAERNRLGGMLEEEKAKLLAEEARAAVDPSKTPAPGSSH